MNRFDPRIYLFTVGHFTIDWAQGAIPALLPFFIATCNWSYQDAGTLIFANLVFSSVLQPVLGYDADRASRPWFAPLGIVLSGVSISVLPFVTDYWTIFLCAMVSGLGSALYHPEGARMVNGLAGEHKGRALGTFSVGGNAGFAVGPMFAGFCAYVADIHLLLFYAVFNTAVALLLLHRMPAIQRDIAAMGHAAEAKGQAAATKNDWASFGKLTILIFARSIGFDVCNAFLPLYLISALGATAATGSLALTLLFGLGAVITYFGGILADRLGYVRILRIAFFVMIPAMFLLVNSGTLTLALLFLPLVAFALFAPYSSAVVLGQTYLGKNIGFASGVTLGLTTTFGGLVTPLIGRAADQIGIAPALQILWIVAIIGAVCSFALRTPEALKQPTAAKAVQDASEKKGGNQMKNTEITLTEELTQFLKAQGAALVGIGDMTGVANCYFPYGIAVAVPVPKDIVASLKVGPTKEYAAMYAQMNQKLNGIVLAGEKFLRRRGYAAYARTTDRVQVRENFTTLLPHKTVATRAGLGWIGKNGLLVTETYGSAVRLSSLLAAAPLDAAPRVDASRCGDCQICVKTCPAGALHGKLWEAGTPRDEIVDVQTCYEKQKEIMRERTGLDKDLCGKCFAVCRYTQKYLQETGASLVVPESVGPVVRKLADLLQAELHFAESSDVSSLNRTIRTVCQQLKAQGHHPYIIKPGAAGPLGMLGYVDAMRELYEQAAARQIEVDHVLCCGGTGTTYGGVLLGTKLYHPQTKATAVAIGRRFRHAETLCRDIEKAAQLGGYPCPVEPADVHVHFSCGQGANCPTVKGRDAMHQMAALEGIFLDPLFTGKAFAGLLEMAKAGAFPPKSNIVFLHTGGAVTLLDGLREKQI